MMYMSAMFGKMSKKRRNVCIIEDAGAAWLGKRLDVQYEI
jgi:hypothetical protein